MRALKIWGHRGCRGPTSPPENSLRAFQAAIDQGADGVELDVFPTRDGHLVVFHDDLLEPLSNGSGTIASQNLRELRAVRLKSYSGVLTQDGIPTLCEVLDAVDGWRQDAQRVGQDRGRAADFVVNIETKGVGAAAYVAAEVEQRIASGWSHRNFLNSSFDIRSLREMRRLFPELRIGALFEGPLGCPAAPWEIGIDELRSCIAQVVDIRPDTINLTLPSLRQPGALALIRQSGSRPVAWTSEEVVPQTLSSGEIWEMMCFLIENDITLITDFPGPMRKLERACRPRLKDDQRR